MIDDEFYYGGFENDPPKEKVIKPFKYYPNDNCQPGDFSGNQTENEDYEVWKEPILSEC